MTTDVAPTLRAAVTPALMLSQFHQVHLRAMVSLEPSPTGAAIHAARLVLCEDLTVSAFVLARQPLALSCWRGRTGLSELPRLGAPIDWRAWAARVRIDIECLRRYAEAVYGATDAALQGPLSDWSVCLLNALLLTLLNASGVSHSRPLAYFD